jgi:hypothetical protein
VTDNAPMITVTCEVVAALGHIRRCDPVLAGRCAQCDLLQDFWAQARALIEPMKAAEPSATVQTRARLTH